MNWIFFYSLYKYRNTNLGLGNTWIYIRTHNKWDIMSHPLWKTIIADVLIHVQWLQLGEVVKADKVWWSWEVDGHYWFLMSACCIKSVGWQKDLRWLNVMVKKHFEVGGSSKDSSHFFACRKSCVHHQLGFWMVNLIWSLMGAVPAGTCSSRAEAQPLGDNLISCLIVLAQRHCNVEKLHITGGFLGQYASYFCVPHHESGRSVWGLGNWVKVVPHCCCVQPELGVQIVGHRDRTAEVWCRAGEF